MQKLGYWLVVSLLVAVTIAAFRYMAIYGWSARGMVGLAGTLVCFALLLSFGLSMRDRGRRSPPIAR